MKILFTLLFLLSSSVGSAEMFYARVVGVQDGDSIIVLTQTKQRIRVRLEGIDAPEMGQDFGRRAKETLSSLVFNRQVQIKQTDKDRYGRTVAVVFIGNQNINLTMVQKGLAWHFTRYNSDPLLQAAERLARKNKIGLWSHKNPIPPWVWRKKGNK